MRRVPRSAPLHALPRILAVVSRLALAAALGRRDAAAAQTDGAGFEFSGAQRTRYETLDPQFRAGFSNSDQAVALQTTLVFNWRRDAWQVGGEIMDSRSYGNDSGSFANGTTTNTLEPIQAYVAWRHDASTFRVGRVTQDLGKRRLVARNRYRNTVNNFTGVDWSWTGAEGRAARAFYWVPMRPLPADQRRACSTTSTSTTAALRDSSIAGFFYQFPAFAEQHRLEAYVFDAKAEAARRSRDRLRPRHARRARVSSAASGAVELRGRGRAAGRRLGRHRRRRRAPRSRPSRVVPALRDRLSVRRAWVAEPHVPVRPRDRRRGPDRRAASTASTRCSARAASTSGRRASTASSRAATSTRRACG